MLYYRSILDIILHQGLVAAKIIHERLGIGDLTHVKEEHYGIRKLYREISMKVV